MTDDDHKYTGHGGGFPDQFYTDALAWLDGDKYMAPSVPATILEAINTLDIMDEDTAVGIVGSFYNIDWFHKEHDRYFCSARFAASLMARQRNLHVARIKAGLGGDIFGLWDKWVPEIYTDFYGGATGYVYEPFEVVMNERGWKSGDLYAGGPPG